MMKHTHGIYLVLCALSCFANITLFSAELSLISDPLPNESNTDVVTLFVHGLGGNASQANAYREFASGPLYTFDFGDAHDTRQSNLGGSADVQKTREQLQKLIDQNKQVVLYGLSRGASTVCNLLATLTEQEKKHVVVAIAESPFAELSDTVYNMPQNIRAHTQQAEGLGARLLHWLSYALQGSLASTPRSLANGSMKAAFPNSEPDKSPLSTIENVPHHIPVLFVGSREDTFIPVSSTTKLYSALCKAKHPNAYLFIADHGVHANITNGSSWCQYAAMVHIFLQHHNLPYDDSWADHGAIPFNRSQPDPKNINI